MKDKKLMHKAANMSEMNKEALICRLYGYFEIVQSKNASVTADDLFNVFKEEVEDLTKEKLARAATQTSK